jgi:hypothetical protein
MRSSRGHAVDFARADDSLCCELWFHPDNALDIDRGGGLASVVIGGLVTSTLLTLLLLPVLCQWIFENERVTDEKQHLEEHAIRA